MLFNRVCEIVVGQSGGKGISIKELRMSFAIDKNASETPNRSSVRIWNLSPTSRALIETPNNAIIVKAGYSEDVGAATIFVGVVTRSITLREGADWVTELELADGLIAYRDNKISVSYSAGTSVETVIKDLAPRFGLPVRPYPNFEGKTYPQGFSFTGRTREAMKKACDYAGLEWSMQNQEVQVIKKGGTLNSRALLISSESGMIGSPEPEAKTMTEKNAAKQGLTVNDAGVIVSGTKETKKGELRRKLEVQGYKIRILLQPNLSVGELVKVKSKSLDDFFRIEEIRHVGDTHGNEWQTELSLRFI